MRLRNTVSSSNVVHYRYPIFKAARYLAGRISGQISFRCTPGRIQTSIQMCFMTVQAHVQARTYVCVFARIRVRVGPRTHSHKQNKHLFVFVAWHKCFYTVETEYFWIYWGIFLCSILTVDNFSIYSRWVVGSTKLLLDWCILYILYIAGRDRTP